MSIWQALMNVSSQVLPLVVALAGVLMLRPRARVEFDDFFRGAQSGLKTTLHLFPTLCAMLCGVSMLRASGLLDQLAQWLSGPARCIGIPSELLPLLLTRPFSGSASTAMLQELLTSQGADSFVSACASVIMGSSDTVVYILAVYFSSVGVRRTRHAFPCALAVMCFCIFFSCFLCRLLFS